MNEKITNLFSLLLKARPMGIAFVIVLATLVVGTSVVLFLTPSHVTWIAEFESIPAERAARHQQTYMDGIPLGPDFPGCYWGQPPSVSTSTDAAKDHRSQGYSVYCLEHEAAESIDNDFPTGVLSARFRKSPDWVILDSFTRSEITPPSPSHPVLVLILLLVTGLLLRGVAIRQDLARASSALRKSPWILTIVPVTMFGASNLFNALLPIKLELIDELRPFFAFSATSAFGFIFVLPLFEEAAFRQWLYVRTIDRLPPWVVGVGSAWFFMLAHIFNPQVQAMLGYLPTVFVMGLVLFWIRHRYGSFSLAALAHMVNNGIFLTVSWWVASRV